MAKKTTLKLVASTPPEPASPPRELGEHGRTLWLTILNEYDISDGGGREMLALACQALDRAEACRAQIDEDGEMLRTKTGMRENPLLKSELANRGFIVKTLGKLG